MATDIDTVVYDPANHSMIICVSRSRSPRPVLDL
jgi:hypothetical protein